MKTEQTRGLRLNRQDGVAELQEIIKKSIWKYSFEEHLCYFYFLVYENSVILRYTPADNEVALVLFSHAQQYGYYELRKYIVNQMETDFGCSELSVGGIINEIYYNAELELWTTSKE